jgi:hypothetical protein
MGQRGDPSGTVIDDSWMSSNPLPTTPGYGVFGRLFRLTEDAHHG